MDGEDQHLSPERPRIVVGGDWIGVPVDDLPLDRYHRAADAFPRGDPAPVKELYSQADDMALANPFGPARRGRETVMAALDYASGRMSDGQVLAFDELARYTSDDLVTILALEHWRARIGDGSSVEPFDLRVTTTFRRENAEELVQTHQRESTIFDPVIAPPRREATGVHPTTQACVLVLSAVFVRQAGEPDLLSSS